MDIDLRALVIASLPKPLQAPEVPDSEELQRIVELPRRAAVPPPGLEGPITDLFSRYPKGHPARMELWPIQAWSLSEMARCRGLFGPIPVGSGKTLISYLAPVMLRATRPLLLIPAALRDKTRREFLELSAKFYGFPPESYRIESYQRLSTAPQRNLLNDYRPDLIVSDECQHLRNTKSAAYRRVRRYLEENPGVMFVGLSGTITKRSILDYYQLARWALKAGSPLPAHWTDAAPWAAALDEKPSQGRRVAPGALVRLATHPGEVRDLKGALPEERTRVARTLYRRRFSETPGVVASRDTFTATALTVSELDPEVYPLGDLDGMRDHWMRFRGDWELPDGQALTDALEVSRHARELSLGFFYRWTTQPPEAWREARRAWGRFVRETLKRSHTLDTELQVIRAIEGKAFAHWADGAAILADWRGIQPVFTPVTEPCWTSEHVLRACAEWVSRHPRGIVWVDAGAFGERLSSVARVPFYGAQGVDLRGQRIEDHPRGCPMIASRAANGTGRNLQAWTDNLLTAPPYTGSQLEQVLGRTHRNGQTAETVSFELIVNCYEHSKTFWSSVRDCEYTEGTTGVPQKVSIATIDVPDLEDIQDRKGPRWSK